MKQPSISIICLAMIGGCCLLYQQPANAQSPSLFQMRDHRMSHQFSDLRARRPGDLLFVMIKEQSDIDNKDKRQLQKQNSSSSDANASYTIGGDLGSGTGNLGFDQESAAKRKFDGRTEYTSEREYLDQFTVRVIDIDPNGNLTIRGTRNVTLEGDNRTLVLTGVVRTDDVSRDNRISSQMVSSLRIRYESDPIHSAENKFINQGWLGKKLNRWWPY